MFRGSAAGALLVAAMVVAAEHGAAAGAPAQASVRALLDVPYVAQTPALCGGAAVAMVLRYWGKRDVFAQDFAPLVGEGDGGILTGALASAVRDRGWQALVVPSDAGTARTWIRSELNRGRPLIALIDVGARIHHYVVIVGSTDQEVVVHDPARAPFRVLRWAEFDRAWTATGRWMMLVLPPDGFRRGDADIPAAPASADTVVSAVATPCGALVDRGVQLALTGDREGAEQVLVAATGLCPDDPASWRELAGLRFVQSRWREAQDLALAAVRLAPEDAYAWQLVATSRYLMGDTMGALAAWNRTGEPRIDAITILGAERTRQPVVVRVAGLQPRQVLTPEAFGRAARRLRDLPVAANARVRYEPLDGGLATLNIVMDERPMGPSGWPALAILGARAVLFDEVRVGVAGPLGAGELLTAAWRWSAGRPRVALGLAFPSPRWFSGIVSFEGSWERQSYDATPASSDATLVREERHRIGLHVGDWSTSWFRWQTGAALDRLHEYRDLDANRADARDHLAVESTVEARLAGDRLAVSATGGWWTPLAGGTRFATGGFMASWLSTDDVMRPSWSAVTGIRVASRVAPLALWPGAGTGQGRSGLLRAHPLLESGVLTGAVFGRDVANGTIEYVQPMARPRGVGISIAGFVDAAKAWRRLDGLDNSRLFVDAGAGLRLRAPGSGGAIRIDVAHGLRGGATTLSASWGAAWPR